MNLKTKNQQNSEKNRKHSLQAHFRNSRIEFLQSLLERNKNEPTNFLKDICDDLSGFYSDELKNEIERIWELIQILLCKNDLSKEKCQVLDLTTEILCVFGVLQQNQEFLELSDSFDYFLKYLFLLIYENNYSSVDDIEKLTILLTELVEIYIKTTSFSQKTVIIEIMFQISEKLTNKCGVDIFTISVKRMIKATPLLPSNLQSIFSVLNYGMMFLSENSKIDFILFQPKILEFLLSEISAMENIDFKMLIYYMTRYISTNDINLDITNFLEALFSDRLEAIQENDGDQFLEETICLLLCLLMNEKINVILSFKKKKQGFVEYIYKYLVKYQNENLKILIKIIFKGFSIEILNGNDIKVCFERIKWILSDFEDDGLDDFGNYMYLFSEKFKKGEICGLFLYFENMDIFVLEYLVGKTINGEVDDDNICQMISDWANIIIYFWDQVSELSREIKSEGSQILKRKFGVDAKDLDQILWNKKQKIDSLFKKVKLTNF